MLGTGIRYIRWREMEILPDAKGKPVTGTDVTLTLTDVRSVGRWQRFRNSFARLFSAEI